MAIRAEADILLVDEVLAVGDADFQRKCFDYFKSLKKNKKTVVFVSHDMEAVKEYCDRALLIDKSEIVTVGEPAKIAKLYNRMFMEEGIAESKVSADANRWGSGQVIFEHVKVHPTKLIDQKELVVETVAHAKSAAEDAVFGFSISNAAGQLLLGTNSQLKGEPPITMKVGDRRAVTWKVPHIFNDGEHFITLAIVKGSSVETYDWWEEAGRFTVLKEEHNPYPVNPPIEMHIEK
jgi:ABC-2 type transport system ATP-binding protein